MQSFSLKTIAVISLLSLSFSYSCCGFSSDIQEENLNKKSLIEPIQSIQEAMPLLENLDDKAIVLFDIDGVITIPAEPCLHPAIFKKYESF